MTCFIYFGDKLFNKLSRVSFVPPDKSIEHGVIFNTLNIDNKQSVSIQAVYPTWHLVLYKAGNGIYHCGFGSSSDRAKLVYNFPKNDSDAFSAEDVCAVSGWNSGLVRTAQNTCLLLSYENVNVSKITDSRIRGKIKQIALTDQHGYIITDDGFAYCFEVASSITDFQLVPQLKNVISNVACGKEHTLFLTINGQIYSFGNGSRGQLGNGCTDAETVPRLIEALDGLVVKSIAAGGWHSAAITESEDLYTWGWNESGQLGRPCNRYEADTIAEEICLVPKLVIFEGDTPVKSVSLGSRHSAALLRDRTVWTWGWNKYGQLGSNEHIFRDIPNVVELPKNFKCLNIQCNFWGTVISGVFEETD